MKGFHRLPLFLAALSALAAAAIVADSGCTTTSGRESTPTATPIVPPPTPIPTASPSGYYVLMVGGSATGSPHAKCWIANILPNGAIAQWTQASPVPTAVSASQLAASVGGNKFYIIGGDPTGSGATSACYQASVNSSGILTAWATASPIPAPVSWAGFAKSATGNIYVVGGYDGSAYQSSTYGANYSGTSLNSWLGGPSLPQAILAPQVALPGSYLYVYGGYSGVELSSVYRAVTSGNSIGAWSSIAPELPVAISQGKGFAIPGHVFLAGGFDGTTYVSTLYHATVDGSGNLSTWVTNVMPEVIGDQGLTVVPTSFNGYIFSVGGNTGALVSTVYAASFVNGTLGPWAAASPVPATLRWAATAD